MQLLSHFWTLGALPAPPTPRVQEFMQRPEAQRVVFALLALLVLAQVVRILAFWVSSKAVVDAERATIGKALKLWIGLLVFLIVLFFASSVLLPVIAALPDLRRLLVFGGVTLFTFLVTFLIPMKIYDISFWRALGMMLLAVVIEVAVMFGVLLAAMPIFFSEQQIAALEKSVGKDPAEKERFFLRLAGQDAPDEIDRLLDEALQPIGPPKSLPQREADVLVLQQKLQMRRVALQTSDPAAVAGFQRQYNRYLRLLNEIKAARNAPFAGGKP